MLLMSHIYGKLNPVENQTGVSSVMHLVKI